MVQAPLNLVEFVVDRFFALDVLAVQLFDHVKKRPKRVNRQCA